MSVKLLLKSNKKNKQGLNPIYLRVTIDRKSTFTSTGHYINKKQWNPVYEQVTNHPLADTINADITNKKREVLEKLVMASVDKRKLSAKTLKQSISLSNIFEFAEQYKIEVAGKRSENTLMILDKHLMKLVEFHGSKDLFFENIDTDFLNAFEHHLRNGGIKKRKEDSSNYIHAIMKSIRRLFNAALKKKIITHYPFEDYEMPEYTADDKEYLNLSELDQWEKYIHTETRKERKQTAIYYLFGCYTGFRISDWYQFDPYKRVKGNYIVMRAKKNGEMVSMPLYDRLKRVVKLMKENPLTIAEKKTYHHLNAIAKDLNINKHLSSHTARKTFAVTLCLERGISSETAATLMGITLEIFVSSYSKVTPEKIRAETMIAWKGL